MTADTLTSAIASIVEKQVAPLRSRLEALERERAVRETPEALVTVAQLAQRQPAFSVGAIRWALRHRRENGLQAAVVRRGHRLMLNERRFVAWAEQVGSEAATRAGSGRPCGRLRRRDARA